MTLVAVAALLASLAVAVPAGASGASYADAGVGDPPSTSAVYRFWSPNHQSHFYTMSVAERDQIISSYPLDQWTYEGAVYNAFAAPEAGTVPLYRFWSSAFGGHFFTTSEAEKEMVIANYDDYTWLFEGIAYYVYPADYTATPTLDVARFWSPSYRHHFYTASAAEADGVRRTLADVWTYEGTAFRVPTSTPVPATPLPAQYVTPPPVTPPPVVPPPSTSPPSRPADKDCSDFATHAQAVAWFQLYFPYYGDFARLDADGDLNPCESLP